MLTKIRNLSSHPVILLIFGMLILVFVLFFGMPSQGGFNPDAAIFSEWSARVNDTEIMVNDALLYASRRSSRSTNDLQSLKTRIEEMTKEALLDQSAKDMGWQSTSDDHLKYIASHKNIDFIFFGDTPNRISDLFNDFKKTLPEGTDFTDLGAEELLNTYNKYAKKKVGFQSKQFRNILASWRVSSQDYIDAKGRELRIRSYLNYLKSQIKVSEQEVKDQFEREEESWRFSYVMLGSQNMKPIKEVAKASVIDTFLKDKKNEIQSYYKKHIENYSKSKLKFTQVTSQYSGVDQEKRVKERVEEAHALILKGEDPQAVTKKLSTDGVIISAFVQGNKTRKNTSEAIFKLALTMKVKTLSPVTHKERPVFNFQSSAPPKKSGSYSFIRLEEKTMGEEKSVKDVEREIAQILINDDLRKKQAKLTAEKMIKDAQKGKELALLIEEFNTSMTPAPVEGQETPKSETTPLTLAESGEVKMGSLINGEITGVGREPSASDIVLNQLMGLNEKSPMIGEPLEINGQWVILSLKEHTTPNDADLIAAQPGLKLSSLHRRQGQFLGFDWITFAFFGPNNFDIFRSLPREILTAFNTEASSYSTGQEGFLVGLLKSDRYQKLVETNPVVTEYFKRKALR